MLLLNPDPHSSHATLVQKYCISQGVASAHHVHVFDCEPKDLVASCMWTLEAESMANVGHTPSNEDDESASMDDKVKIAWRYERMDKFKTTVSSASSIKYVVSVQLKNYTFNMTTSDNFCEAFDLSCKIPSTVIEHALSLGKLSFHSVRSEGDMFETIASRIKDVLANTYDQCVFVSFNR